MSVRQLDDELRFPVDRTDLPEDFQGLTVKRVVRNRDQDALFVSIIQ
jgi:hypothetical protein